MTKTMSIDYHTTADSHVWEICDGEQVAELVVNTNRHEIMEIWVRESRRGEGLARRLYEIAVAQMPIYHAPVGHRTPEGHAFAEAVGGDTAEYDCDCYACTYTWDDEN